MGDSSAVAIIPARIGSTRLERKPLREVLGVPLVVRCMESVARTGLFQDIVVATDALEVKDVVESHGGKALLTDPGHPSGTDRVFEAASRMGLGHDAVVVNIQGDQPMVERSVLQALISFLEENEGTGMVTPVCPMTPEEALNPNRVKVVVSGKGHALYFSRAPIPHPRDGDGRGRFFRHIGVYAYRYWFLRDFVMLPHGPLEGVERLEQLRALENEMRIGVVFVDSSPLDVDTEEDLREVEACLRKGLAP